MVNYHIDETTKQKMAEIIKLLRMRELVESKVRDEFDAQFIGQELTKSELKKGIEIEISNPRVTDPEPGCSGCVHACCSCA
jgi:hypothetical protein